MSNSNNVVSAPVVPVAPVAPVRIENTHIESGNMVVVLYGATTELVRGVARYCRVFSRTAEVADDKVKSWQDGVAANAGINQELAVATSEAGQRAIRAQIEAIRNNS